MGVTAEKQTEVTIKFSYDAPPVSVGHPLRLVHEFTVPKILQKGILFLQKHVSEKVEIPHRFALIYPNTEDGKREVQTLDTLLLAHTGTIFTITAPENSTTFYYHDRTTSHQSPRPISSINLLASRLTVRTRNGASDAATPETEDMV